MTRSSAGPIPLAYTGALLALAGWASVAWPLATYTVTLALFGVAHVLSELRYVDLRFGARLRATLSLGLVVVLVGIVVVRATGIAGVLSHSHAMVLELGLGLALVALVLPTLFASRPSVGVVGVAVAAALVFAIVVSPPLALLGIAVLHNFTPVGFVLEATRGAARRRAWWAIVLVFGAAPLLIASGLGWRVVATLGIAAPESSPLGYGPLQDAMAAYLPANVIGSAGALHLFSACVFLQCAHYVAVLLVLPRLLDPRAVGRLGWPSRATWLVLLAATSIAVLAFAFDFVAARRGYGVLAAVHAWVELPILLLALLALTPAASRSQTTRRSPAG